MGFALSTDLQLTSSAFEQHGAIPTKHTGEGQDVSPALSWSNPPAGTKSYAIICHDPDAPLVSPNGTYGFVHWTLYNIPGEVNSLPEGCADYTQGTNNFGENGYKGPMPPEGHGRHHYYYWVLALDAELNLPEGLSMWELLEKVEPHTLAMNRLIGTYQRG
ncbi:YbhB/YbcL family Raf kinase inhibitor-like protein [Pseudomonas sp. gcc21]|uniref:YbhB/YbcL family Raf kinase inhibitor-like protein n=1 Tax=Pseudomonas sp. gcc21 TaxID=2726989 RepID=UPI0014512BCC|nr:YbhB/YbcL family Raf kinase inhibitor-like protein [Pseudomonas sp. gcc21]QJD59619.1 YbhB/YbcL family Raf kinase inhibitor-like protein [Pseudomonas sp. gcc21]